VEGQVRDAQDGGEHEADDAQDPRPGEEFDEEHVPTPDEPGPQTPLTSVDDFLELAEADRIARRRGLRVVLLAGEIGTGKTTALVALWQQLIAHGSVGVIKLAGSLSALAFERRAYLSRSVSGMDTPETERTLDAESGWLHLRLRSKDRVVELLLSDLTGEVFKRIREAEDADAVLPFLGRVDLIFVAVDGEALADRGRRQFALASSRRLLSKLGESQAVSGRCQVRVVLTKADLVHGNNDAADRWAGASEDLLARARLIDPQAEVFELAARPADPEVEASGLERFAASLVAPGVEPFEPPAKMAPSSRIIGRFQ